MDIVKDGIIERRILDDMKRDRGMSFLSKHVSLTECFIKSNADEVDDSLLWREMILNQRHINPYFFDRFFAEMDDLTKSMLSRRQVMFDLMKIINRK